MCGLHVEQDRMWLRKNRMPGLFSFPFHSTMQDKFTPQEPFVGCTAQAICSLLGERQLMLHLSPPAAGYNSAHFEPLSRGADGGFGIRIAHHHGSAGKQKTHASGPLQVFTKEGVKCMTLGDGNPRWVFYNKKIWLLSYLSYIFLLVILAHPVSFVFYQNHQLILWVVASTSLYNHCTLQHSQTNK